MFQDIQHFQQLSEGHFQQLAVGQAGLGHHVGFKIPGAGNAHAKKAGKKFDEKNCFAHKTWSRPWAKTQGDGYMKYDNQLFWDHGFEYSGANENLPQAYGDDPSSDRKGFIGWKCNGGGH